MASVALVDHPSDLLAAFPDLVELFPLDRFLARLLQTAARLAGASPVACFVPVSNRFAADGGEGACFESLPSATSLSLLDQVTHGSLRWKSAWGLGLATRHIAGLELRVLPCHILTRPVGYLLLRRAKGDEGDLAALARLAGYYLHRHEAEVKIEQRFGRRLVIMGGSPGIFALQEDVERFARLAEPLLIRGESGSGKEIVAQAVHVLSQREQGPFVAVNCASAPSENLLLDEFFGHRRGAFTGATYDKDGCCHEASGGTLFLDEIGDMSHELQTLLLRTLTTGDVRRIGDERSTRVDFRLLSATHRELQDAGQQRRFRVDLYYRISAFQLHIPPLRERPGDIPPFARYIVQRFAEKHGLPGKQLLPQALAALVAHPWPGNVRELENVLKRAFALAPGNVIGSEHLKFDSGEWPAATTADELLSKMLREGRDFWSVVAAPFMRRELTRDDVERVLEKALAHAGGALTRLAADLNLNADEYPRFVAFLHRHGFRRAR